MSGDAALHSPWLSLPQAAAYARLSLPTLRRAIRSRRLQAVRVNGGRVYRVRVEWIEAYLSAFTLEPTQRREVFR
jgi:excisionase family DNA binding protein